MLLKDITLELCYTCLQVGLKEHKVRSYTLLRSVKEHEARSCTLLRSAIVSSSERELDFFSLLEIEFWREVFRVQSCLSCQKSLFACLFIMASKAALFCAHMEEKITPTKTFLCVSLIPENTCIRLQCVGSVENAALRRRLFSGSTKTQKCQNLELLLGDLFEVGKEIVCRNCAECKETG